MTDANNMLEPGSLRAALRHFSDPSIAAVAGRRGERRAYDRYESMIRTLETRSGRRGDVGELDGRAPRAPRQAVPEDAVVDDLWLVCNLARRGPRRLRAGGRVDRAGPRPARRGGPPVAHGAGRLQMASSFAGCPGASAGACCLAQVRPPGPARAPAGRARLLACALGPPALPRGRRRPGGRLRRGPARDRGDQPAGPRREALARLRAVRAGHHYAVGVGLVRGLRRAQGIRWDPVR